MKYISLYQLQSLVDDAIQSSVDSSYWVVAEISELKVNASGHCYMELVEKNKTSSQLIAKAKAVIWSSKYKMLNEYFCETTSTKLRNNIKVLVCVRVSFHAVYGLSYVIEDIEPAYTLGDIEKQRQETIQQLKNDGVFDMNKESEVNDVIQNIAVISSSNAAGYTDFMKELEYNKFGYKFNAELFDAVVQGDSAQESLQNALERIYDYSESVAQFDAVVMIRGGGSTSDLSCFDSYEVASVVAQFPIAVLAGIGHDKDVSVVDLVAYMSFKTPTAVAQYIVEKARDFDLKIQEALDDIMEYSRAIINEHKNILSQHGNDLLSLSRVAVSQTRLKIERLVYGLDTSLSLLFSNESKELSDKMIFLKNSVERKLEKQKNIVEQIKNNIGYNATDIINKSHFDLELIYSNIEHYNPKRILNLGYCVINNQEKNIHSIMDIKENDYVKILCKDGQIEGNIINIKTKQ